MRQYDFTRAAAYFDDKTGFTTGVHELEVLINSNSDKHSYQIVDARYPKDYAAGHVPGAVNLRKANWANPTGLDKNATLYLYCYTQTCHMAAEAAVELLRRGYRVVEVEGGWQTWVDNGYPVETTRKSA